MTDIETELNAALTDLGMRRPDVGTYLTQYGETNEAERAVLEFTRMSHDTCDRCGEDIGIAHPGPVAQIDERTGREQGSWSHQHGCGEWNAPIAVRRTLSASDEAEDANPSALVVEMLAEFNAAVAADMERRTQQIVGRLRRELRHALSRIEGGADPEDVTTGSDIGPGVYHDGEQWIAWEWAPLAHDGNSVVVTENDLHAGEQAHLVWKQHCAA